MDPRPALLFIHLLCMGTYFMALGIEYIGAMRLGKEDEHRFWLKPTLSAAKIGEYALLALFFTGGGLISGVKKADQISFLVTLVPFLILGGLAGMAAGRYKKLEGAEGAKGLVGGLRMRIALSAGILFLVSAKPDLTLSVATVVVSVIVGAAVAFKR